METICYRFINDSFTVPGLKCLESVMLFNNGMSFVDIENFRSVKAGYGIRLRYLDERGVRRCVSGFGTVLFFGIDEALDCSQLTISTGEEVSSCVCGNFVQVRAKIALAKNNISNNIAENVLTN